MLGAWLKNRFKSPLSAHGFYFQSLFQVFRSILQCTAVIGTEPLYCAMKSQVICRWALGSTGAHTSTSDAILRSRSTVFISTCWNLQKRDWWASQSSVEGSDGSPAFYLLVMFCCPVSTRVPRPPRTSSHSVAAAPHALVLISHFLMYFLCFSPFHFHLQCLIFPRLPWQCEWIG